MGDKISIEAKGLTLGQLLFFQAVVVPELVHVLERYERDMRELGCEDVN